MLSKTHEFFSDRLSISYNNTRPQKTDRHF